MNLPADCSLISSENDTYAMSGGRGGSGIEVPMLMVDYLSSLYSLAVVSVLSDKEIGDKGNR